MIDKITWRTYACCISSFEMTVVSKWIEHKASTNIEDYLFSELNITKEDT